MILFQLSGVAKLFGEKIIVRDIDLTLQKGERVGLVGSNGSGKSTILRIIDGEWEASQGALSRAGDTRVAYLPQSARVSGKLPLYEEMETVFVNRPQTEPYDYKIRMTLHGVGLPESFWRQPTSSLSGGEKCRAALARVLLSEPDVLLLDEPTNHLDIAGREWLESFLARFEGAVVLVAHDRVLLDRATNRTAFLHALTLKAYPGSYSRARELWEKDRDLQEKAFLRQREEIKRQEDFIARNIAGQKTKQAQSRRKMLAKLERLERPEAESNAPKVGWQSAGRSRAELLRLEKCELGYADKPLASVAGLTLRRGDKIGVVGPNGCGKSTLIRTLLGDARPLQGEVRKADRTEISYFRQEVPPVSTDETVEQHFWSGVPDWKVGQVRSYLARFLFKQDDVQKSMRGLSGGERRRLELARITVTPAHLLILDEPTNHLDILAQEAVESALQDFDGSLLLVSHDRELLDNVCEKLWVFEGGQIREFLGSYTRYAEQKAEQKEEARSQPRKKPRPSAAAERQAELRRLQKQVDEAEERVARLEAEIAAIDDEGRDPRTAENWERLNFLATEKRKKQRELERWLKAWEEAAHRLEDLTPPETDS